MSTLTSSRSPAASPRDRGYHIPQSPRHSAAALHARSAITSSPTQLYDSQRPLRIINRRETISVPEAPTSATSNPSYVNAATQYSPLGSPPTSRASKVAPSAVRPGSASSGAQKRKESERSQSPVAYPMSSTQTSSSSSVVDNNATSIPAVPSSAGRVSRCAEVIEPSSVDDPSIQAGSSTEPQEARSTHGHSLAPKRSRPEPSEVHIMPSKYETCSPKDLGVLISNMLMELIRLNDQIPLRDGRLTRFHSRAPPGISVADYLQRLILHATLSPPILLSMVYYIDRLCNMYSAFTINSLTVHRFLITAATVASKGLSDSFWTNPTYARIGGIPVSELATLELEFLQRVQWKIVPQPEILEEYYRSLVDRTQGFEFEGSESDSSSLDESDKADNDDAEERDDPAEATDTDSRMVGEPD